MKPQVPIGGVKNIETFADAAQKTTTAALATAAVTQIIMNGALAQLWGMINGLCLFMHMPAMNLTIPAVAAIVVEKLLGVFTFDFPGISLEMLGSNF